MRYCLTMLIGEKEEEEREGTVLIGEKEEEDDGAVVLPYV